MGSLNSFFDDEEFDECRLCAEEHPVGALDGGYCPACVDFAPDEETGE